MSKDIEVGVRKMNGDELDNLNQAIHGDELARERLIRHYMPYIINVAGHITKKFISWSDEEASIALLAFNRAIDTFNENAGRTFLNYAYLLINRDLIDYYRREKRERHQSLDKDDVKPDTLNQENEQALEQYEKQVQSIEVVEEILELDAMLRPFKISFEELEQYCPKHTDTRLVLFEVAATIAQDRECLEQLQKNKKLPITLITKKIGYKKKTLERHRKYIITLILMAINPQWEKLSHFIKQPFS